jgi:CheY-like chemotaxis protein
VFEPFFTTKAEGTGTGLGLSTVYGIVRQAGGWIGVDSQQEMGATFRIGLPLLAEPAPQTLSGMPPPKRLEGSETVLVVEDQDEVRKLALAMLKRFRYPTLEARSGSEALLTAQNHPGPIHLLLTDVVMPHMTGIQLAERLTLVRPETKVLYMSGYSADVILRQGALPSEIEYIQKPFTPEALVQKVRKALGEPRPAGKVLVVDDEEGIRGLFARILTGGGYEVSVAADGDQAQISLEAGSYDLVITDLVMPNREGIETIRTIRQGYPGVKIIAISGAFGGSFLKAATLLGADATLLKPVDPGQLLETVRKTLG